MRRLGLIAPLALAGFVGSLSGFSGLGHVGSAHAAAACTPTGFIRDGINLTAAQINPTGVVSGTVDATGCNIGVYYGPGKFGLVNKANIFGANYYGIVNDGGRIAINQSNIHDIGESPLNGDQHGVGIYFAFGSKALGTITGNTISRYQKGGVVVNGAGSYAFISHNTVQGNGPVDYIAQNGIQIGYGASGIVSQNTVSGNSYTGPNSAASAGILVFGGCGDPTSNNVVVDQNRLTGNDIGIQFQNLDATCSTAVTTPTHDIASNNTITNNEVNNTTGNGDGTAYQAGIADQGDGDVLTHNTISGFGYTPVATPPPHLYYIDDTATNNVIESHNSTSRK